MLVVMMVREGLIVWLVYDFNVNCAQCFFLISVYQSGYIQKSHTVYDVTITKFWLKISSVK